MEFKKNVGISEPAFVEYQVVAPDHAFWRKITGTLIIIAGVGIYLGSQTSLVESLITVGAVSIAYLFLVTYVNKLSARIFSKRNYKKHKVAELRISFEITSEAVKLALNEKQANYKWNQIKDIVNTPLGFYFYINTSSAIILDKKYLNNKEITLVEDLIVKYKDPQTKLKLLTTTKN